MDGIHDMGGMHGFGAVVVDGSEAATHEPWEGRVFALSTLVGIERLGHGSGRAIREEMAPAHYLRASYYERWLWSTEQRLLRNGTIVAREVEDWIARLEAGNPVPHTSDSEQARRVVEATRTATPLEPADAPRFATGERARVRRMRVAGHNRCPRYVRGVSGTVRAVRGIDVLPGAGEAPEPVYAVAFDSDDVFGPSPEGRWEVVLDLWESYLEAV